MNQIFNEYYNKWLDDCGEKEPNWGESYGKGWSNCKKAILNIIKNNISMNGENPGWKSINFDIIEDIEVL